MHADQGQLVSVSRVRAWLPGVIREGFLVEVALHWSLTEGTAGRIGAARVTSK